MLIDIFGMEFDAEVNFLPGESGTSMCPPIPDDAEFSDYGPFHGMFDAVYTACWVGNEPMTLEAMQQLAFDTEAKALKEFLNEDNHNL